MFNRQTAGRELDRLVVFISSHIDAIGDAMTAAIDLVVAAQRQLPPVHRARIKHLIQQFSMDLIENFRESAELNLLKVDTLREIGHAYAELNCTEAEVRSATNTAVSSIVKYLFEQSAESVFSGLIEFTAYYYEGAERFNQIIFSEFRSHLSELGREISPAELIGQALLYGDDSDPAARDVDRNVRYTVAMVVSENSDLTEGGRGIWSRFLDNIEDSHVYWALSDNALVLIFPESSKFCFAEETHRQVSHWIGARCWVTIFEEQKISKISRAVAECRESYACLRRLGYAPGVYNARSTLFERVILSADPEILEEVKKIVRPVIDRPKLAETLFAWITHRARRGATAKSLGIHQRTLDYRLRQIREITAFDPADNSTLGLLHCAAIAWSADRKS
ncbi:helix-turn-helix domain-containing protein [Nocardia sp. R6R-6]|uniref:helix-turn-helix domain-containing protein n=1 Tax=Nocardia sp. R6R-6 TaxID=3459303 RepID=UPI00403E0630